MSDEDIVTEVSRYPAATVILTGGAPSLWIDREFVDCLHQAGKYVCIETNGTHPLPDNIDWVTCSPKMCIRDRLMMGMGTALTGLIVNTKVVTIGGVLGACLLYTSLCAVAG